MEKILLKHLTVKGFVKGIDLTKIEKLQKKLDESKTKLKVAKKEVSEAKKNLNIALEESLTKIENDKKELKDIKNNESGESMLSSAFSSEQIKTKYEVTMTELELRKNEIKKRIEEYKSDGSEKWKSFKNKLNRDLEELGKALKGFTVPAS